MPGKFDGKRGGDGNRPRGRREVHGAGATRGGRPAASRPWRKEPAERPVPPDDVCWGRQPVLDLVKGSPSRCTRLLIANNVRPPFLDELVDAARAGRVVYQMVAPEALDKLCPDVRHQGVACRVTETEPVELEPFLKGLSGAGAATIRRAHAVQPVAAVENQYSFLEREQEAEVLPVCEELGIGFVPYAPLGMGYLTGTVAADTVMLPGDLRATFPRFTTEGRRANWPVVELLRQVGYAKGATPAQVALAWLLAQRPWIVPIFGTTKIAHVDENVAALDLVLDEKDLRALNDGFARIEVYGRSSGDAQLANIDLGAKAGTTSAGTHGLSPLPGL